MQVSSDGKSFKPVGRSYVGLDWEASDGEFSGLGWSCCVASCLTTLPSLPAGSVYALTTIERNELNFTRSDKVARFLEQATFGATNADIENLDASNLSRSFASWIEKQQKEVPMTSHRAVFRWHMNDTSWDLTFPFETHYTLYLFQTERNTRLMTRLMRPLTTIYAIRTLHPSLL